MIKALMRRRIDAFERATGYDTTYMRELLDASFKAFRAFAGAQTMSAFRQDVPVDAWHAARIAATLVHDCGPCVQLSVTFAEQAPLPTEQIRAMLTGNLDAMGGDAALAWRFAHAASTRDPEADDLRAQVEARWGRRALMTLALQVAVAGVYPAMKFALGHGRTCARVRVGNAEIVPWHAGYAAP